MGFNYANEKAGFDRQWAKHRRQCKYLRTNQAAIRKIFVFALERSKSRCWYINYLADMLEENNAADIPLNVIHKQCAIFRMGRDAVEGTCDLASSSRLCAKTLKVGKKYVQPAEIRSRCEKLFLTGIGASGLAVILPSMKQTERGERV